MLSRILFFIALQIIIEIQISSATQGFDASVAISQASMKCLKSNNYEYGIIRAYHSYGDIDKNACQTLKNGEAEGIKYLDIYMFPCVSNCENKKNASIQVKEMIEGMAGCPYQMIWVDIEPFLWYENKTMNQQFALQLVGELVNKYHKKVGIYASHRGWGLIMGLDFAALSKYPIW